MKTNLLFIVFMGCLSVCCFIGCEIEDESDIQGDELDNGDRGLVPNGLVGTYFDNADLTNPKATRVDAAVNFNWGTGSPVTAIGSNTFSVRWTGFVKANFSQTYTFYTLSDDGVRLWVNNQLIVNDWTNHPSKENKGTIALQAGKSYPIKMEYYDNTGGAVATLSWSSASQSKQIIPQSQLFTGDPSAVAGLVGTYFDNADLTNQKATRVDAAVNFNWGKGAPVAAIGSETFSVRWTGFLKANDSQTYTFYTLSDDGVRLWVNNQLIVNNWTNHGTTENRGTIALQAGTAYPIKLEYYDNTGDAVATLSWSSASQTKQVIPQSQLSTDNPSTDQCPTDPNKTLPGICGCGVAETDSDKDSTPDCKDGCKTDPNKTEPGACGCGVLEGTCQTGFVSKMVNYDANGQLRYGTDAEGNRIPDFSYVGYKYGEALPSTSNLVPANQIKTISPIAGDNTAHLQSAIDEVGKYPVQSNGYRGIVKLNPGIYLTHNIVYVRSSGVVVQGSGRGDNPAVDTIIKSGRSGKDETVLYLGNPSGYPLWTIAVGGSNKTVTSSSIPIGQRSFQVNDASPYRVGDMVVISQTLNDNWYSIVDLPRFYTPWGGTTPANKTWREHGVATLSPLFVRFITGISGNQITVDAPFYHRFVQSYGAIQIYKYNQAYNSSTRLYDHIGIDNLRIDIETTGGSDEEHTERAIEMNSVVDGWARNITNLHAAQDTVLIRKSTRVTFENCESIEPVSIITGGRRYGFTVEGGGQQILFKDCLASDHRHGFVLNGSESASGVVFLRGILENNLETSEGGHQRWSMGVLFDNCELTSYLRNWLPAFGAYNRGAWGTTSHGWASANSVFWNVDAGPDNTIVVQKPPTAQNYAIGCFGKSVSGVGPFQADPGYIEGTGEGEELQIPSLYQAQLSARR